MAENSVRFLRGGDGKRKDTCPRAEEEGCEVTDGLWTWKKVLEVARTPRPLLRWNIHAHRDSLADIRLIQEFQRCSVVPHRLHYDSSTHSMMKPIGFLSSEREEAHAANGTSCTQGTACPHAEGKNTKNKAEKGEEVEGSRTPQIFCGGASGEQEGGSCIESGTVTETNETEMAHPQVDTKEVQMEEEKKRPLHTSDPVMGRTARTTDASLPCAHRSDSPLFPIPTDSTIPFSKPLSPHPSLSEAGGSCSFLSSQSDGFHALEMLREVRLEGWQHRNWLKGSLHRLEKRGAHGGGKGVIGTGSCEWKEKEDVSSPPSLPVGTTTTTIGVVPKDSHEEGEGNETCRMEEHPGKAKQKPSQEKTERHWERKNKDNTTTEEKEVENRRGDWVMEDSDCLLSWLHACRHLTHLSLVRCNLKSVLYSSYLPPSLRSIFSSGGGMSCSTITTITEEGSFYENGYRGKAGVRCLWTFFSQLDFLSISHEHSSSSSSLTPCSQGRLRHCDLTHAGATDQAGKKDLTKDTTTADVTPCDDHTSVSSLLPFSWLLSCNRLRKLSITHTRQSQALSIHEVGRVLSLVVHKTKMAEEEVEKEAIGVEEEADAPGGGRALQRESPPPPPPPPLLLPLPLLLPSASSSYSSVPTLPPICSCADVEDPSCVLPLSCKEGDEEEEEEMNTNRLDVVVVVLPGGLEKEEGACKETPLTPQMLLSLSPSRTFLLFQLTELDLSYTDVSSLAWMRRVWWRGKAPSSCGQHGGTFSSAFYTSFGQMMKDGRDVRRPRVETMGHTVCLDHHHHPSAEPPMEKEEEVEVVSSILPHLQVLRFVGCARLRSLDSLFYVVHDLPASPSNEETRKDRRKGLEQVSKDRTHLDPLPPSRPKEEKRHTLRHPLPPLHLPQLHTLDISWSGVEDLRSLACLALCSRGLSFLSMNGCKEVGDQHYLGLLKELRVLHAQQTTISDLSWIENCQQLEEVDIQGCVLLDDITPLARLPRLKRFFGPELAVQEDEEMEKKETPRVPPQAQGMKKEERHVEPSPCAAPPSLPFSTASTTTLPLSLPPSLFSALTALHLHFVAGSEDGGAHCPKMITRGMERALQVVSPSLSTLSLTEVPVRSLSFLHRLTQLRRLSLHHCRGLPKQLAFPPLCHFPSSRSSPPLSLEEEERETSSEPPGTVAIPPSSPRHQKGNNNAEEELATDVFAPIAALSQLVHLELSDLALSSVSSFLFPGAPCTGSLQDLNLSLCTSLHDLTGVSSCSQLTSITLSDASLADIHAELQHCAALEKISISYLDTVEDFHFVATASHLTQLSITRTEVKTLSFFTASPSSLPPPPSAFSLPPVDTTPTAVACGESVLADLHLAECPLLSSLPSMACLTASLRSIHFTNIAVEELHGIEWVYGLEDLRVESCLSLRRIPCSATPFASSSFLDRPRQLPLKGILLHHCPVLHDISWMMGYNGIAAITDLRIHQCPQIGSFPRTAHKKEEHDAALEWQKALAAVVSGNPHLQVVEIVSSFTESMTELISWLIPRPAKHHHTSGRQKDSQLASHPDPSPLPLPVLEEQHSRFSASMLEESTRIGVAYELTEIRLSGLTSLQSVQGVENLPHLTTLSIHDCPRLTSYTAIGKCSALVRLHLSKCKGMTHLLDALWTGWRRGEENEIPATREASTPASPSAVGPTAHSELVTEEEHVSYLLPALQELDLADLPDLTSVVPLLSLHMSGTHPFTDAATASNTLVTHVATPTRTVHVTPQLYSLRISSCPQFVGVLDATACHVDPLANGMASASPFASSSRGNVRITFASFGHLQRVQLVDLAMLQSIQWLSMKNALVQDASNSTKREEMRKGGKEQNGAPEGGRHHRCTPFFSSLVLPSSASPFAFIDTLDISFCISLSSLEGIQHLHALQKLTAMMCVSLSDVEPLRGAPCLKTLKEVDFSFCHFTTEANCLDRLLPGGCSSSSSLFSSPSSGGKSSNE